MTRILLLFICITALSCNKTSETKQTDPAKTEPTDNTDTGNFQTILDSIYQLYPESIGIMVHVESPENGISWSGSVGYSDKENKTQLLPDQPALIASSIKTYVSAAILRLQEEGKLNIEDPIGKHLTEKTITLFQNDGYEFDQIKIKHLLSHTSGIADYVDDDYFKRIDDDHQYRWTRDEQLKLATEVGNPLGEPQELFQYADVNYLLATEIIEQHTQKPFYESMGDLLRYEQLDLKNTWFPTLEDKPNGTKELVHQYWNEKGWGNYKIDVDWDSYEHDISWDLYGGGGIATTMKELAQFSYHLFNGHIIEDETVLNLITTDVPTTDGTPKTYRLGVADARVKGFRSFGHGGFWGTMTFYIPKLDASISVCVLERNGKMKAIRSTLNAFTDDLSSQLHQEDVIIDKDYTLYKAKESKATLILYPGGGTDASYTKQEFDIVNLANANNVSVLMMNFNSHLWVDDTTTRNLSEKLEEILTKHHIESGNTFIGGMSLGGNMALTLSNYLYQNNKAIAPKGVFVIDSPIDLYALYQSALTDVSNPDFDEERLAEPKWIINYFEEAFTKDSLLANIQTVSPFVYKNDYTSVPHLKDCPLRFYTEPDADWWKENRQTAFENTNAYVIQEVVKDLKSENWQKIELIQTENKGYRSNGERHPHSWSIADMHELVKWMKACQ